MSNFQKRRDLAYYSKKKLSGVQWGLFKRYRKFWEDLKSSEGRRWGQTRPIPAGSSALNNKIERLRGNYREHRDSSQRKACEDRTGGELGERGWSRGQGRWLLSVSSGRSKQLTVLGSVRWLSWKVQTGQTPRAVTRILFQELPVRFLSIYLGIWVSSVCKQFLSWSPDPFSSASFFPPGLVLHLYHLT